MKISQETGSEANTGFRRALMPSYFEMCPPKAAFVSFQMQPILASVSVSLSTVDNYLNKDPFIHF